MVVSAMFTQRTGAGSAKARKAAEQTSAHRGLEVRIGGLEQKLRTRARAGSAEAGGSKMRKWRCALSFYSTYTVP